MKEGSMRIRFFLYGCVAGVLLSALLITIFPRLALYAPHIFARDPFLATLSVEFSKGTISFEQFRLISVGESEGLILGKLGKPYDKTSQGKWIYFRDDGWVVTLTFANGRVSFIQDERVFAL